MAQSGSQEREAFPHNLIARMGVACVLIPSIWPYTFRTLDCLGRYPDQAPTRVLARGLRPDILKASCDDVHRPSP